MADDIQNIGTGVEIFPQSLVPNFMAEPTVNFQVSRDLRSYEGTATEIDILTLFTPWIAKVRFDFDNKIDEYNFINFFHNRIGMLEKFWFIHPKGTFELKDPLVSGESTLVCYPNLFNLLSLGIERIYLRLINGDLIVRQVVNCTYSSVTDEMNLELATQINRDIDPEDITNFGRFLLVRYNNDTLRINYESDGHGIAEVNLYELVREYETL